MRLARLALGLCLVAAACSLGPREDWAEAIRDAPVAAADAGGANVTGAAALGVVEAVALQADREPLIPTWTGVVDFDARESRLTISGDRQVLAGGYTLYLPRSAGLEGESPWVAWNFGDEPEEDIDGADRRLTVGVNLMSPYQAVDMLLGVLTGSIEEVGAEDLDGVPTTIYEANFSQDAAAREIEDEDRRESFLRIFEAMGVGDDVFPGRVWVGADGLPYRVRYVMEQVQDRGNVYSLTVRFDFTGFGTTVEPIEIPGDAQRPELMREFITEFIRERVE